MESSPAYRAAGIYTRYDYFRNDLKPSKTRDKVKCTKIVLKRVRNMLSRASTDFRTYEPALARTQNPQQTFETLERCCQFFTDPLSRVN